MIFGTREARVQFEMNRSDTNENKFIFDYLYSLKNEIEQQFGHPLEWLRLDARKASRIQFKKSFDGYNRENWSEMTEWLVFNMMTLERSIKPYIKSANEELKQASISFEEEV